MARRETDKYAAQNRKARHNFLIQDTLEAGMVLAGTEVKMLRQGGASINEAYAAERDGALYLINAHIPEYKPARVNHDVDEIAVAHESTVAAVALAWLLAQPTVIAPIASATSPEQLAELLPAVELELSDEEIEARLTAIPGIGPLKEHGLMGAMGNDARMPPEISVPPV